MQEKIKDDTIYRQAAIDALRMDISIIPFAKAREYVREAIETIYNRLEELPSAQSEPHWIPCSEKLPDNGRQVLVFARSVHFALAKYDEMREADGTYKKQWVTFDAWKPFYTIKEVIAWRELPKPYAER